MKEDGFFESLGQAAKDFFAFLTMPSAPYNQEQEPTRVRRSWHFSPESAQRIDFVTWKVRAKESSSWLRRAIVSYEWLLQKIDRREDLHITWQDLSRITGYRPGYQFGSEDPPDLPFSIADIPWDDPQNT